MNAAVSGGLLASTWALWLEAMYWRKATFAWDRLPLGMVALSLSLVASAIVCGMLGGLTFWLCTVWRDPELSGLSLRG